MIPAAITTAATTMIDTVPFADEAGRIGAGVVVGSCGVSMVVGEEVGHSVMVGRMVGVPVGRVGVGVLAVRMIIF